MRKMLVDIDCEHETAAVAILTLSTLAPIAEGVDPNHRASSSSLDPGSVAGLRLDLVCGRRSPKGTTNFNGTNCLQSLRACDLITDGMKTLVVILTVLAPCATAADIGADLFREHCAPCHGPKGEGGRGANLAVRRLPRAPDDASLGAIIAQGIPGTEMPVTRMTDQERADLIAFVRSLGQAQTA